MTRQVAKTTRKERHTDLYELALLLAEGQAGSISKHWDAFIDNLSRVTDAFAQARVRANAGCAKTDVLLPV